MSIGARLKKMRKKLKILMMMKGIVTSVTMMEVMLTRMPMALIISILGKVMASTRVALKEVTFQEEKNTVLITITTKATPLLSSSKLTLLYVQFMNDNFCDG